MTYSPVVEFSAGGKPIRFSSNLWSSWPKPHIGEKVGVLYDKDHPEDARIDGFLENWFAPIALAVLGICLTLSAFGVFQANNDESSACWEMTSID